MHDHDTAPELPSCRCGTTRQSKFAIPYREYGTLGTFYLLWGGTAIPTKVTFRCVRCDRVIETITGSREAMRPFTV